MYTSFNHLGPFLGPFLPNSQAQIENRVRRTRKDVSCSLLSLNKDLGIATYPLRNRDGNSCSSFTKLSEISWHVTGI